MSRLNRFLDLPLSFHLVIGFLIRLMLVLYGDFHDRVYDVPYTDVDYKVFTDAARHVLQGESPYKRHTYRYSPVIAYLLTPNILISKHFGKLLFSVFDILLALAVKRLVEHQLEFSTENLISSCLFRLVGQHRRPFKTPEENISPRISAYCALFWLYNPMSIAISSRGNADSVPCFFIIVSLLFLETNVVTGLKKYVFAGIFLGLSIHLRLYPLAFTFPMFLSLGKYAITRKTSIKDGILALIVPNKNQIVFALSCVVILFSLTYGMYEMYKYEFLFETYIYHIFRKDTKHNFSVLFYYSYLTMDQLAFDIVKSMSQILIVFLLFWISLAFGAEAQTLNFALFCQAVVLVAFNGVITSQYFIWFLSLLPLVVHSFRLRPSNAVMLSIVWMMSQGAWLFYAYLLEFKSQEMFILIWLMSVAFFSANIFILGQLIKSYAPGYGFGLLSSKVEQEIVVGTM